MLRLGTLHLRGLAVRVHSAAHPSPQGNVPVHVPTLMFRPLLDVQIPGIPHTQSSQPCTNTKSTPIRSYSPKC